MPSVPISGLTYGVKARLGRSGRADDGDGVGEVVKVADDGAIITSGFAFTTDVLAGIS